MGKNSLKISKIFIVGFVALAFVFILVFFDLNNARAQTPTAGAVAAREAELKAELEKTEKEIAAVRSVLKNKQKETASLERDAAILNAKIQEAKLVIRARNLAIERLGKDITKKSKEIGELIERIERGKESLAQLIRKTNELDSFSVTEMLLSNNGLSDFFSDLDSFDTINRSLQEKFDEIKTVKYIAETEKQKLSVKKNEEIDAKVVIETEKRKVEISEAEKKRLANISKTEERAYGVVLKEREKKAAQIRSALFALRDSAAIPFGTALSYANDVQTKTGVRAALLLAIITQESDLGKNQGSCLVSDLDTGNGAGKNTGTLFEKIMKAPQQTSAFKNITERLGRDWKMTPVSCPPSATYYSGRGFGGGMGPSQFIPLTWELLKRKIGATFGMGGDSVDPWNPAHSFMASGLYLRDLGASAQSYTSERNAACKYYSGSICTPGRKPPNVFYGDQVMAKAKSIQENMIDPLQNF